MKFRNTPIDGFFIIHTSYNGKLLTERIQEALDTRNADIEDLQFSTHIENGSVINDVLVMYRSRGEKEA